MRVQARVAIPVGANENTTEQGMSFQTDREDLRKLLEQISDGKLQLPDSLKPVMKALDSVTNRIQEQNASINDLLAEGAEIASRLKNKLGTKTPVAASGKKR